MRRSFVLVTLTILLAGLILFGLSDTSISAADTGTSNNGVTSTTGNSSASATITITMYTLPAE